MVTAAELPAVVEARSSVTLWLDHLEALGGTVGGGHLRSAAAGRAAAHDLRVGGTALTVYEPGNGTRYVVSVVALTRNEQRRHGAGFVVALPENNDGCAMWLPSSGLVDPGYVGEKLRYGVADATHLAALLTWTMTWLGVLES